MYYIPRNYILFKRRSCPKIPVNLTRDNSELSRLILGKWQQSAGQGYEMGRVPFVKGNCTQHPELADRLVPCRSALGRTP